MDLTADAFIGEAEEARRRAAEKAKKEAEEAAAAKEAASHVGKKFGKPKGGKDKSQPF